MMPADFESSALIGCSPVAAVEAFNAVYAGYLVPLIMTLERFERRFRSEDLDPFESRMWHCRGAPVALLLISRRGRSSRISAFGVSERLRRQGIGRSILEQAVDEARARGDTDMWLEVFEANARARSLYRSVGFKDHSRLLGFDLDEPVLAGTTKPAQEVSLQRGIEVGSRNQAIGDLPWMIEPATLAAATPPVRCFLDADGAVAAFIDPQSSEVRLVGLLGNLSAERCPAFMRSVRDLYPSRSWKAPPVFPEEYAPPFFEPSGWRRTEMLQSRMVLTFDDRAPHRT